MVACDLGLAVSDWGPRVWVVRLRCCKGTVSFGRFQFAFVRDGSLVSWFAWFTHGVDDRFNLRTGGHCIVVIRFERTIIVICFARFLFRIGVRQVWRGHLIILGWHGHQPFE